MLVKKFFEIDFIPSLTSKEVITKLKRNFALHGIPEIIISDNGTQYTSQDFIKFCQEWKIKHCKISPGNSRANGAAESAVKIAKRMMKKCNMNKEDPYIALLNIRNTPQEGIEYSPVQRLMGRRTRTLLPTNKQLLEPQQINNKMAREQLENKRAKFGARLSHRKELKPLHVNDNVKMQPINNANKTWQNAVVKQQQTNRSYIVQAENGTTYRRDRQHLRFQNKYPKQDPTMPQSAQQRYANQDMSETCIRQSYPTTRQYTDQQAGQSKHASVSRSKVDSNTTEAASEVDNKLQDQKTTATSRYGRNLKTPNRYGY